MNTFIDKILDKIVNVNSDIPLEDTLIVLPNRRSHRKLLKGLSQKFAGKTFFAPTVFPMDEFVSFLSPLHTIDQTRQLIRLHEVTRNIRSNRFSLEKLHFWGSTFLKDISDMDMQLQDTVAILKEHAEAAKFEIRFGNDELSQNEQDKIMFNEILAQVYVDLKNLLKSNCEAYSGMIYRDCAENIEEYSQNIKSKRVIFAGFYALSPSELQIIKFVKEHFPTEIYFDADKFYCHSSSESGNSKNQTSFFLNRDCDYLGLDIEKIDFFENDYAEIEKSVNVVSTSKKMRQIYVALSEIERIKAQKIAEIGEKWNNKMTVDMSDTVVVLADESMLSPFISSYNVDNVELNVTMEFPRAEVPAIALINSVIELYDNAMLISSGSSELIYPYSIFEDIVSSKFLKLNLPDSDKKVVPSMAKFSELPDVGLFEFVEKGNIGKIFPTIISNICKKLEQFAVNGIDADLWHSSAVKFDELQNLFDSGFKYDDFVDFSMAKRLTSMALNDIGVTMKGNPDTGLHVTGILETRMSDYKNVIMLSVNEGVLPKGLQYDSMLPFDFKYKFDGKFALENYLYRDQVFAYHFFRLLQRAENVTLVYNSVSDGNLAEKSRFISQLEFEVENQNLENIKISESFYDFDLKSLPKKPIIVQKDDDLIEKLLKINYSPSSIKDFIHCPMKFYFKNVVNIQTEQQLSDELGANEIGTVIHAIFKNAFDEIKDCKDRNKYGDILDSHIQNIENEVVDEIIKLENRDYLSREMLNGGSWLLNRKYIESVVKNYLIRAKSEVANPEFSIVANEQFMKMDVKFPDLNDEKVKYKVKLLGFIDRIHKIGDTIVIVDYKTGKVESKYLKVAAPEEIGEKIFGNKQYEQLLQLALYTVLYKHNNRGEDPIKCGILSTKEVNKKNADDYLFLGQIAGSEILSDYTDEIYDELILLLRSVFDKKTPFVQANGGDDCKYCDYRDICY